MSDVHLHSFPTRRSSDLKAGASHSLIGFPYKLHGRLENLKVLELTAAPVIADGRTVDYKDRKSTRLNSSHVAMSYAVFCWKKRTTPTSTTPPTYSPYSPP